MTSESSPILHAVMADSVGEFAALTIRELARAHDPVLVIGPARSARVFAQILGRPVRNAPTPRVGTDSTLARIIARTARATGASEARALGMPHMDGVRIACLPIVPNERVGEGFAALPSRDAARSALGFGSELVLAPLTDRPQHIDARTLMFITGVIEIIGQPLSIVLPSRARRLAEALAYHHGAGLSAPVRIVEDAWISALPAADVFVEPIDADDDPACSTGRALAATLDVPIAMTDAWHLDPDAATNSLPAEIRATVAPVLATAREAVSARAASATVTA